MTLRASVVMTVLLLSSAAAWSVHTFPAQTSALLKQGFVTADQSPHRPDEIVQQPNSWRAFSATFRVTHRNGSVESFTKHRSSNGSTVTESGPLMVSIENFLLDRFYSGGGGQWLSRPLGLQERDRRPFGVLSTRLAKLVGAEDARVRHLQDLSLTFYEMRGRHYVAIISPELNLENVWFQTADELEEIVSIDLAEPEPALFVPPSGVIVTERSDVPHHRSRPGRPPRR